MAGSIEVKPRFFEPDAPTQNKIADTTLSAPIGGLFTSVYENKIIVFIIVIIIIIIAICAYIFCRKTDDETKKSTPRAAPATPPTVPPPAATEPEPAPPPAEPAANKTELVNLLARSKNLNTPAAAPAQNTKSKDEIMQLMEDEAEVDENTTEQEVQSISDQCTIILSSGRQCHNKAKINGKCSRHKDQ